MSEPSLEYTGPDMAQVSLRNHENTRVTDIAKQVGSCIGVGLIVALPVAAVRALDNASVETSIGPHPATLQYTYNGESSLQTGIADSLYIRRSWHNIGISAQINGSGLEGPGDVSLTEIFSSDRLNAYVGLAHDPKSAISEYRAELKHDAIGKFVRYDLLGGGVLAALAFSNLYTPWGRIRRPDGSRSGKKTIGWSLAMAAVAGTSAYASVNGLHEFRDSSPTAKAEFPIRSLDKTSLEGAYATSEPLQQAADNAIPLAKFYYERGKEAGAAYVETVTAQLEAKKDQIAVPQKDETAFLAASDMHNNEPMIRTMANFLDISKEVLGDKNYEYMLMTGDGGYGTPWEHYYYQLYRLLTDRIDVQFIKGNHEVGPAVNELQDAGVEFIRNEIKEVGDTTILGMDDPRQTILFGGETKTATEKSVGEAARKIADSERPDLTAMHEGYAVAAFMGIDDIKAFKGNPKNYRIPYSDGIADIPTAAILFGHWHETVPIRMAYNSDGTWTPIIEQDSAGGAIGTSSLGRFSILYEPPKQKASYMSVFKNKKSGLITGFQLFRYTPEGEYIIEPRVNLGSPDGQPYEVDENYRALVTPDGQVPRPNVRENNPTKSSQ